MREPLHALGERRASFYRATPTPETEALLLLCEPDGSFAVNGEPVRTGVVALANRDEIRLPTGERVYVTTERTASIETYTPAGDEQIRCPRCRKFFEAGDAVVRCPADGCGVLHHQTERLPCFTYTPRCAVCERSSELGGGPSWTPGAP